LLLKEMPEDRSVVFGIFRRAGHAFDGNQFSELQPRTESQGAAAGAS